jgi:hypothetical protein
MVDMASERVVPNDAKRAERLTLLRAEVEAALDAQKRHMLKNACHISKLPYEVLSGIMLLAVETEQSQLLSAWIPYLLFWPLILAVPLHRLNSSMRAMEEHCNRNPPTLANPSTSNKKSSQTTRVVDTEVWRIP